MDFLYPGFAWLLGQPGRVPYLLLVLLMPVLLPLVAAIDAAYAGYEAAMCYLRLTRMCRDRAKPTKVDPPPDPVDAFNDELDTHGDDWANGPV